MASYRTISIGLLFALVACALMSGQAMSQEGNDVQCEWTNRPPDGFNPDVVSLSPETGSAVRSGPLIDVSTPDGPVFPDRLYYIDFSITNPEDNQEPVRVSLYFKADRDLVLLRDKYPSETRFARPPFVESGREETEEPAETIIEGTQAETYGEPGTERPPAETTTPVPTERPGDYWVAGGTSPFIEPGSTWEARLPVCAKFSEEYDIVGRALYLQQLSDGSETMHISDYEKLTVAGDKTPTKSADRDSPKQTPDTGPCPDSLLPCLKEIFALADNPLSVIVSCIVIVGAMRKGYRWANSKRVE